jgi:hypothetical protein
MPSLFPSFHPKDLKYIITSLSNKPVCPEFSKPKKYSKSITVEIIALVPFSLPTGEGTSFSKCMLYRQVVQADEKDEYALPATHR